MVESKPSAIGLEDTERLTDGLGDEAKSRSLSNRAPTDWKAGPICRARHRQVRENRLSGLEGGVAHRAIPTPIGRQGCQK